MRIIIAALLAANVFVDCSAAPSAQTQLIPIALRTIGDNHPAPRDGIVTLTLESGAWIRLRALDIDYERTIAYKNRVIINAETATPMAANETGRKYLNLTFSNRFVATAWEDDVDSDEARKGFPIYNSHLHGRGGPTQTAAPSQGATAQCRDGSYSFSANRSGTCSHHGGVARWLR